MEDLSRYLKLFEAYRIENGLPQHLDSLYEPIDYLLALPGKRLRPIFSLLFCELHDSHPSKALPVALAIEYFHNFTLMHDDIMDQAPVRRGYASVHYKYNTSQAILSGDALFTLSLLELLKLEEAKSPEASKHFLKTALQVCEGQQLDMDFEERADISEEAYLNMIKLKTSVLLATSAALGALVAGANSQQVESSYQYALNLGLAFQIKDDWLDAFGEAEKVGKQKGGDIIANKKTLLYIEAISLASPDQRSTLSNYYSSSSNVDAETKVTEVVSIFKDLKIDEIVEHKMIMYYNRAIEEANNFGFSEEKKGLLNQLAEYVVRRAK